MAGGKKISPVIYLGYHKTASKWVWNHFFRPHYPCHQVNLFDQPPEALRGLVTAAGDGASVILRQRIENGLMGAEFPGLAERIAEVFPEARIVTCIRSQRSLLPSHYTQYVANGGRLSFPAYLDETVRAKWHYYPVVRALHERFEGRVLVYLFEEFRHDPYAVLRDLRDFVGASVAGADKAGLDDKALERLAARPPLNPQRNDLVVDAMLLMNRLRLRHHKNAIFPEIRRPGHDHIVVEAAAYAARRFAAATGRPLRYRSFDDRGVLERAYGAENEKLSRLLERPLRERGYPG
jgi:hypothetical protein